MVLETIDNKNTIARFQSQFERKLKTYLNKKIQVRMGHLGGYIEDNVFWSDKLKIWMCNRIADDNRYWNAFGIQNQIKNKLIPIVSEINFPIEGIVRRTGGVFLRDEKKHIYVGHRGNIGGSNIGIGKTLFFRNYNGELVRIRDGSKVNTVALVASLNSPRFARQIQQFVNEIYRIKNAGKLGYHEKEEEFEEPAFEDEFSGKIKYKRASETEASCDHGLIVSDLNKKLSLLKYKTSNKGLRDLFIINKNGKIKYVFEVKTGTSTTSIYTGVGQLLLINANLIPRPKLVLVIPDMIDVSIIRSLKKLGINTLFYKWIGEKATFQDLNKIL